MDYDRLLNLTTDLGYQLMASGAEIYRVEESMHRVLNAYGLERPEVFAIPNCIIVSVTTPQGHPITRMRRIPGHGTDTVSYTHLPAEDVARAGGIHRGDLGGGQGAAPPPVLEVAAPGTQGDHDQGDAALLQQAASPLLGGAAPEEVYLLSLIHI